jgi:hypothetical protein
MVGIFNKYGHNDQYWIRGWAGFAAGMNEMRIQYILSGQINSREKLGILGVEVRTVVK